MILGTMQFVMGSGSDAQIFERAKRLGLKGVEPDPAMDDLTSAEHPRLRALRDAAASTGMAIPSLCLGFHNDHGFIARPDRSDAAISEIRVAIEWAAALGASVILLPFFFKNDPKGDATKLARTAQILKPLCTDATARGITLCYEGTLAAEDLHELATRIDSSTGFGVYFDLANVYWAGMDGPDQIRKQGRLIRQVHMKETKVGPGDVRPGLGRVDYAASAMALREIGYDSWLMLETPPGDDAAIAQDIAFTQKFFT